MKKLASIMAIIASAVIIPTALHAQDLGQNRETFTMDQPASYVTFNSITDNPNIGDERNFVSVRENGSTGPWEDSIAVEKGKEYVVRMYVHNDAAANLNLVAENVKAKFVYPSSVSTSNQIDGYLSWGTDTVKTIYDYTTLTSDTAFNLLYVDGTLDYHNNIFGNEGADLSPEKIFSSEGQLLGYDKLDGKIPGCTQYIGYVTFVVKPQFVATSNFSFEKKVSKHGENKWVESYTAAPGETVDFLLAYKNTGEAQHDNLIIRDVLPAGMTYVAGSTIYVNGSHPAGAKASDNVANGKGINIGSYAPGATAIVVFSAKVADNEGLPNCGENTLVNKGSGNVEDRSVENTASVVVTKTCKTNPPVTPPVTPPAELPHTGVAEDFVAIIGVGSLVTTLGYYLASRKQIGQ